MSGVGNEQTRLVLLRGNSGSGKTTVARELQRRRERGTLAVVSQDVVRREMLWARDIAGSPAIDLIDLMVRFALERGLSVVVEGIFHPDRYTAMLTGLAQDHRGLTRSYFWDLPFDETLARHATKPKAKEFGESEMRDWWYGLATMPGLDEAIVRSDETLSATVERIERDLKWH